MESVDGSMFLVPVKLGSHASFCCVCSVEILSCLMLCVSSLEHQPLQKTKEQTNMKQSAQADRGTDSLPSFTCCADK